MNCTTFTPGGFTNPSRPARSAIPAASTRSSESCHRSRDGINPPVGVSAGWDGGAALPSGARGGRIARRARFTKSLLMGSLLVIAVGAPASAQVRAGGHGLYQNRLLGGSFGYGGRVEVDLDFLFENLMMGGVYDRVSRDCYDCSQWETGGHVGVRAGMVFFGGGVYFSRFEEFAPGGTVVTEDDWIFSLVLNLKYPIKGFLTPFFELQNELGEGFLNRQTLSLGILLGPYLGGGGTRSSTRRER